MLFLMMRYLKAISTIAPANLLMTYPALTGEFA
jgi:hypothetical protein